MAYKDQGIKTPSDLYKRELFREVLDISGSSGIEVSEIIDEYHFLKADTFSCGIKSCRSPHQHGYLVLASNGLETNVGNICGASHGGGKFAVARNKFEKERERKRKKDAIKAFKLEASRLKAEIDAEVESAKIAQRRSRDFKQNYPTAWRSLASMSKTRTTLIINDDLLARDDALKLYRRARPSVKLKKWKRVEKPRVSDLKVSVDGIFGLVYDFKGSLINFSQGAINDALDIDERTIDDLSDRQLKSISEAIEKIPAVLESSRKAVKENQIFFSPENFDKIYYLPGLYSPGDEDDYL